MFYWVDLFALLVNTTVFYTLAIDYDAIVNKLNKRKSEENTSTKLIFIFASFAPSILNMIIYIMIYD